MKKRIIVVMPVSGRLEVLGVSIRRLKQQEGVLVDVICVGSSREEWVEVEANGGSFLWCDEELMIGAKWQRGLQVAKVMYPDVIMIAGSSNWFTPGYCAAMLPYLEHADVVGLKDMYCLDIQQKNNKRLLYWGGYWNERQGEPLGAGRMITREMLEKMGWLLYDENRSSRLDASMTGRLNNAGAKMIAVPMDKEKLLKVSSYRWKQINPFAALYQNPLASRMVQPDEFLNQWFPEGLNLLNE